MNNIFVFNFILFKINIFIILQCYASKIILELKIKKNIKLQCGILYIFLKIILQILTTWANLSIKNQYKFFI